MSPTYVDRLLNEYDEWHEGYLLTRRDDGATQERWRQYREKLRKHLLRAPGRKDDPPSKRESKLTRATDPNPILVNEEVDTRKQEL
jgi:hypothetical protein